MNAQEVIIKLDDFRPAGTTVLTSRPWGIAFRKRTKIDEYADKNQRITITIPNDITSITPMFLEEFLENVVHKLGPEKFKQMVHFESEGRYQIELDLDTAMNRILRRELV